MNTSFLEDGFSKVDLEYEPGIYNLFISLSSILIIFVMIINKKQFSFLIGKHFDIKYFLAASFSLEIN